MRTTLTIADDILRELKGLAHTRGTSLTKVANEALRVGLARVAKPRRRPYREEVADLGEPRVDVDRALAAAMHLDEEETLRKLEQRK